MIEPGSAGTGGEAAAARRRPDGRSGPASSRTRRQSILSAALACFITAGYERTTVADIRCGAGATTGTLYHYFPGGKAQIAAALTLESLGGYQQGSATLLADESDAEAGVCAAVRYHLDWIAAHPGAARFLFADRPVEVDAVLATALADLNRGYFHLVNAWLDRQIQAGALRPLPRQVLYALWLGPAQQLGREYLAGGLRLPLDDAVHALAQATWHALCTSPD